MSEPRFPFLAVVVPAGQADELGYALMELGSSGVELKERGDSVELIASFASLDEATQAQRELGDAFETEIGEIVGDAWREAYKEHFKPFALTTSITVVPSWETYQPRSDETVMHMDPGRAFGTGLHATTSLVAGALEERRAMLRGKRVLDVGTGSGILAIGALLLGAASAVAVDNDPQVIDVALENAVRNGVAERMVIDTTDVADVAGSYDVVLANIRAHVLIAMADDLKARCAQLLILSGVLASELDEVREAFLARGLSHVETLRRDEGVDAWVAIVLQR